MYVLIFILALFYLALFLLFYLFCIFIFQYSHFILILLLFFNFIPPLFYFHCHLYFHSILIPLRHPSLGAVVAGLHPLEGGLLQTAFARRPGGHPTWVAPHGRACLSTSRA